jgi:hypothetical protein
MANPGTGSEVPDGVSDDMVSEASLGVPVAQRRAYPAA